MCKKLLLTVLIGISVSLAYSQNTDTATEIDSGTVYHKLGVGQYINSQYDAAQKSFENAIRWRRQHLGDRDPDLSRSYHNLGVVLKEKGNYQAAIKALKKAANIRQQLEDQTLLGATYLEMGIVYERNGDYENALQFHQTGLSIFQSNYSEVHKNTARAHLSIGIIQRKLGHFPEAISSLKVAQKQYIDLYGREDADVSASYNNLGNVYDDQRDYRKAINAYREALAINLSLYGENSVAVSENYNNLGLTYLQLGDLKQSLDYQNRSLAIRKEKLGPFHPKIASAYTNIGDIYVAQKQWHKALEAYQQALTHKFTNYRNTAVYSNPDLANATLLGSANDLLEILFSKAKTFKQKYQQSQQEQDIQTALQTFQLCDQLIDQMRQSYESTASKLFLLQNAVPIYEGALETVYGLYQKTENLAFAEEAFRLMEKSKSVLLLSSIKEEKARIAANIPEALLEKETDFKADLAYWEQQQAMLALKPETTDSTQLAIRQHLVQVRQQYQNFVTELEANFPKYYREKYDATVATLKHLRPFLQQQQKTLVEYFAGDQHFYAIAVSAQQIDFIRIGSASQLRKEVEDCIKGINRPNDPQAVQQWYVPNAFSLYQQVWAPFRSALSKEVIVIPAGVLGYLPYEALLDAPVSDAPFREYPFLLKKFQLSYAYSATVLLENSQRKITSATNPLLAVAPVFEQSSHFAQLSHSQQEVEDIQRILGGDLLLQGQATKQMFQQMANQYRIIHISSHAAALDTAGLDSWIAFADNGLEENNYKLYLSELYAMQIPAELAVLSACETGRGRISGGEGMMSLARGFAFAGCQSIINTLWQVNHSSTTQIMDHLYEQLAQGKNKDEALHLAKLAYLQNDQLDNIGRHPYYWSAFRQIGNTDPIRFSYQNWLIWWWIFGGFLALGGLLWFRKKKSALRESGRET